MGSLLFAAFAAALCLGLGACGGGSGGAGGIHARMAYSEEGGLRVVDAPPSGPAARAGIAVGDRIVSIDGDPIDTMSMSDVVESLRGRVGTVVRLVVARGSETLVFDVPRAPYDPHSP